MASVERRTRDGRVSWQARWRDPAGVQRKRTFARRVDADRFLVSVAHGMLSGSYVDPAAGRVTFGDYAETWRCVQVHRPSTRVLVEAMLRRHAYPTFGERQLRSIRPSEVQAWVRGLPLQPATAEVCYRYVAGIFRAAVADRLLTSTPCVGVKLPRREPKLVEPLSTDQVESMIEAVPARYRALVVLAAGTGLRQGEAFGLEVGRVDFLRRTLRIDQQLVLLPGAPPVLSPPKTTASYRTVPLPQVVVDALAAHLASYPSAGLVFVDGVGRALRRTSFSARVWRPAARTAGLPAGAGFHALRHYYASLLIRHGESVKVVQLRLGHASAAETLDTYAHLWPDSEDRTREAVDVVLGAAVPAVCPAEGAGT